MGLIIAVFIFVIGLFVLTKSASKIGVNRYLLLSGWILKLFCSVLFVSIFSLEGFDGTSIQGDAYNFFYDSGILADYAQVDFWGYLKLLFGFHDNEAQLAITELAKTNIWSYGNNGDLINDNRLIIRINSVIHLFSFGNIYVHILIFSGLAYAGLILIYKAFLPFVPNKNLFFIFLAAFPSIAFWGSGLTKEALTIFALGLSFYCFNRILFTKKSAGLIFGLIIGCLLLLFNKPYVGIILLPFLSLLILGQRCNWKTVLIPLWLTGILCGIIIFSYAPEKINFVTKLSNRQQDMVNLGKGGLFFVTDTTFCAFEYKYFDHFDTLPDNKIKVLKETQGECKLFGRNPFYPFTISASENQYERYLVQKPSRTYIDVTPIDNSGIQLVKIIPESLHNTFLKPFPNKELGFYSVILFAMNLILIILVILSIYFRKKLTEKEKYLISFLVSASLLLLLVIGWTTPVIGAMVRYKVPAEILILIAVSILIKPLKKTVQ